jgi:hypothetical protein
VNGEEEFLNYRHTNLLFLNKVAKEMGKLQKNFDAVG